VRSQAHTIAAPHDCSSTFKSNSQAASGCFESPELCTGFASLPRLPADPPPLSLRSSGSRIPGPSAFIQYQRELAKHTILSYGPQANESRDRLRCIFIFLSLRLRAFYNRIDIIITVTQYYCKYCIVCAVVEVSAPQLCTCLLPGRTDDRSIFTVNVSSMLYSYSNSP
jgi:hypothetical protein